MRKFINILIIIITCFTMSSCNKQDEDKSLGVDKVIKTFLDQYAQTYLNKKDNEYNIDYYVVATISMLEKHDETVKITDYLSKEDALEYIDTLDYTIPTNIFKASIIDKAYHIKSNKPEIALANLNDVDQWSINYVYSALKYYQVNPELQNKILMKLTVINDDDYRDADYAGMTLCVLYGEKVDKQPLFDLIKNNVQKGGVNAWGNINSCSTAMSIIGLLAEGIDINTQYLDENDDSLITNLLRFEHNGTFSYTNNQEPDLIFATPQGFAACVCYSIYQKTNKAVVLF